MMVFLFQNKMEIIQVSKQVAERQSFCFVPRKRFEGEKATTYLDLYKTHHNIELRIKL